MASQPVKCLQMSPKCLQNVSKMSPNVSKTSPKRLQNSPNVSKMSPNVSIETFSPSTGYTNLKFLMPSLYMIRP